MFSAKRADGEGVVLHTLFDLKPIRAGVTLVLVDWHVSFPPSGPVCLVLLVCFVYLVSLVSFNQTNETNQITK